MASGHQNDWTPIVLYISPQAAGGSVKGSREWTDMNFSQNLFLFFELKYFSMRVSIELWRCWDYFVYLTLFQLIGMHSPLPVPVAVSVSSLPSDGLGESGQSNLSPSQACHGEGGINR